MTPLRHGPYPAQKTLSFEKERLEAESGDTDAQNKLGFMRFMGVGVKQDIAAAHRWFHLAAESGSRVAQRNLGLLHSGAIEMVPRQFVDLEESNHWFAKSLESDRSAIGDKTTAKLWQERGRSISALTGFERGRTVYVNMCAGCHGFDGIGVFEPAPSFALGERLEKSEAVLVSSVLNGLGKMPGWAGTLKPEVIRDTVSFIKVYFSRDRQSGNPPKRLQRQLEAKTSNADPAIQRGQKLFRTFCVGCHGANGIAYFSRSPSFALGERVWKHSAVLKRSIAKGKGIMPGWEHMLDSDQIEALVRYIKSLPKGFTGAVDQNWLFESAFYFRFRPAGETGPEWEGADPEARL